MFTSKKATHLVAGASVIKSLHVLLSKIIIKEKGEDTAAMLACNCPIEGRFWMVTRSDHWFEMLETVFMDKESIPLLHFHVERNYYACSQRWC